MVEDKKIFLVLGMAGSGKTSFCQRLYSWVSRKEYDIDKETGLNSFICSINLDPAVLTVKMPLTIDIRDFVDYSNVMEEYNLGPNGAITTSLNLFLLKSDEVFSKIKEKYVIIDTPGQLEAFTWSSPGVVLLEYLKALKNYKIIILYLIDSVQTEKHAVFMCNMMYAASLMCRYQMDTLCVFNKSDLNKSETAVSWIKDYNLFRESLSPDEMYSPILSSMALHFEEFYNSIKTVCVSSTTGSGCDEFFKTVELICEGGITSSFEKLKVEEKKEQA
jgi:GTPase SAR1 family protein